MSSPSRKVPMLEELNRGFWTGGRHNQLQLRRCANCGFWVHPPRPVCPRCWGRELPWQATSGRATLYTFTINHKAWNPEVPTPYVIGMVELAEQAGLRLSTNIVNCAPEEVHIGMPLRVLFEPQGEHFVPLFEPDMFGHMP
jgi:uncharacterized OB-fold protein